jgi:hypothetical protein
VAAPNSFRREIRMPASIAGGAPQRKRQSHIMNVVEKVVRVFDRAAEADQADALFDAGLSPNERVAMVIELRDRCHPDAAVTMRETLASLC